MDVRKLLICCVVWALSVPCGCQRTQQPPTTRRKAERTRRQAPPTRPRRPAIDPKAARVHINSQPSDALVYIDGKPRGVTPAKFVLRAGKYRMTVVKRGFKKEDVFVTLKPGAISVQWLQLKEKAAPRPIVRKKIYREGKEVWVRAGTYPLGAPKSEDGLWLTDKDGKKKRFVPITSMPQPKGTLPPLKGNATLKRGFWIAKTETTQGDFVALMGYAPFYFRACGAHCPVERVHWHEALAYANALSKKHGLPTCFVCSGRKAKRRCHLNTKYKETGYTSCKGYRLPTEHEWEIAARAGAASARYAHPRKMNWYRQNAIVSYKGCYRPSKEATFRWDDPEQSFAVRCAGVQLVAQKQPNKWDLYDMYGNVEEWCWDRVPAPKDAPNPSAGGFRIVKGGYFYSVHYTLRATYRRRLHATTRFLGAGFRLVRSGEAPASKPTTQKAKATKKGQAR